MFTEICGQTDILQLNCLATDFYRPPAYATYLYYNPHDTAKQISVDVGRRACDLYDACADTFLSRGVRGQTTIVVPADSAVLLVLPRSGGRETRQGGKTLIDGVVIDYSCPNPKPR